MSKDLVIGVDCSTTACKAVVWDMTGRAVAVGRAGYGLSHVRSGWVEQNATEWWEATKTALAQAAKAVDPARIAAVALTQQRETFVCLDAADRPVRPAMTWMDTRATAEVERFGSEEVHRITGKPPNPTPSWYKLLWLKAHEPETLKKTAHVVEVAGYLVRKLTGQWATSWACADCTGLVDMARFDYDEGLLGQAGVSRGQLSRLLPPGSIAGELSAEAAAATGLPAGLPIAVSAGDGQSAALGCNVTKPGRAFLNIGTGAISGVFAKTYAYGRAYRTMMGAAPQSYILETFIGGGTQNVVWFIDQLSGIDRAALESGESAELLMEAQAAKIPLGAERLLCLPYWSGAMSPYWDGHARGAFVGLTGLHGKAHMYRAILEGVALEQRLLTEGVEAATGERIEDLVVIGGGSRSPLWRQIMADALGRPIKLAREQESTALGAGIHAAAAAGLFNSVHDAADAMAGVQAVNEPDASAHAQYSAIFAAYRSLYPSLKDSYRMMAETMP